MQVVAYSDQKIQPIHAQVEEVCEYAEYKGRRNPKQQYWTNPRKETSRVAAQPG
jgi:hypothetical protein